MRKLLVGTLFALAVGASGAAHADVMYRVELTFSGLDFDGSVVVDDFIPFGASIPILIGDFTTVLENTLNVTSIDFVPNILGIHMAGIGTTFPNFAVGSFSTVGTHQSFGPAVPTTLTVSIVNGVPEPGTSALALLGLGALGLTFRGRRRASKA